MKNKTIRSLALLLCAALLLGALCLTASAIDPIDLTAEVSACVTFKQGETPVPGAEFSLYRVADCTEWAEFTASGDFAAYTGKLNELGDASAWDAAARELLAFADKNGVKPLHTGKTDEKGEVSFSGDMEPGMYLLSCTETTVGSKIYSALPCLVCLPNREENSDEWIYASAPVRVKAGDVRDVPQPKPPKPHEPVLPQTGLLWWPVPVLLALGLLFVVIGLTRRRSSRDEA